MKALRNVLPLGLGALAIAGALCAAPVAAQPSESSEVTVLLPAAAAASARAGVALTFGTGPFDALEQPALLGGVETATVETARAFDRYLDPQVDPWAVGAVVPLGGVALAVSHRRTRADAIGVPGTERFDFDLDHDLTSVGIGFSAFDGRLQVGALVHATGKSGALALSFRGARADSTALLAGQDDLLFAASVGAIVAAPPRAVAGGQLELRAGAALRRLGEDVDVVSGNVAVGGGETVNLTRRSALASTVGLGVGAGWTRGPTRLTLATDVVWPVHDAAADAPTLAIAGEAVLYDYAVLRVGGRDDFRGQDVTFGAGLRSPRIAGVRLGARRRARERPHRLWNRRRDPRVLCARLRAAPRARRRSRRSLRRPRSPRRVARRCRSRFHHDVGGSTVTRVLFVCLGNICRSPLAEGVFRHLVAAVGLDATIEIDSAGTGGWHEGEAPDPRSHAVAAKHGVDLSDQSARKVRPDDFASFDWIVAMDADNENDLRRAQPAGSNARIVRLRDFDPDGAGDVPDPYYGGPQGFDVVYAMVERSATAFLEHVRAEADA